MKKTGLIVLFIVLVVAGASYWKSTQPQATVDVVRARTETLRAYVEEQATTELPQDFLIAMPISGWLEPITLREGDEVSAGQVVARLDTADLADRVQQARHRVVVLETSIAETADHRLENHALVETQATVKAIDETVLAAEAKLQAYLAIAEFAQSEVERLQEMRQSAAASDREMRAALTDQRKAESEHKSNALDLAALKTLAAVSYIGPQFIRDYIDRKSFKLETLQQQLAEARTELEIEQRNLQRAEITSPTGGVVLARLQTRRQFLSAGTPLLTIGRLDDLEVIAEVLTERATRISPGDPVEVYGEALSEGPISGSVWRVYPAGFKKISSLGVEQQRVKVAVKLDHRPPRLGVEYRVQVRIYYDEAPNALTLPRTAMFRDREGGWQVMVVTDGVIGLQTVRVGLRNDDRAQILEGLSAADLVIARPSRELSTGMRVETTGRE